MLDPKKINEMVQNLMDAMPAGIKNLPHDIREQLKARLTDVFSKMNLVTREEFDAQTKVLERTREKLAELEAQLEKLQEK